MIEIEKVIIDGVEKTAIKMPRGDTLITRVTLYTKGSREEYVPVVGDVITFAVKSPKMNSKRTEYTDEQPLILAEIPIDTQILRLDPEDTKQMGFGEYVYDLQVVHADGRTDTCMESAPFILKPEVY